ncbi:MAG: metallophosphoesterase [Eubacteriales bacterium]|nr:metallophosphoesterase [Eubacteriales bacterium]
MMMDMLSKAAAARVRHRIWVMSDLQQSLPERATYCMTRAVADYLTLDKPCEAICYLGDAVEGNRLDFIHEMAEMQMRELSKAKAPIYYIAGNHDFDYFRLSEGKLSEMVMPFYDNVSANPQWHIPANRAEMLFPVDMGDYALALFPDHADPLGRWYTTHGEIRGNESVYPYDQLAYEAVWKRLEGLGKPTLTLSHYAFAGGNRAAPLFDRYLPLPGNVRCHLYGHAHVGDEVWAGKDCNRKISAVDGQPIMQINVASLENFRGSAIRTTIVEWYDDDTIGIWFRNHSSQCWDDCLLIRPGADIRVPTLDPRM